MRRNPWFWLVLGLKLVASALFGSHFVRDLFIPFITWFVDHHFQNPWDAFVATGPIDAFPYSGVMLAALSAPQALATLIMPGVVASQEWLRLLLIRLPMLGADLVIFAVLLRWFDTKRDRVLWIYWCSPILFFISYVHGQVDSIPTALLFVSLFLLLRNRALAAGIVLGLGIAAKMHLLIAVPFLAIHLWTTHIGRARWTATLELLGGTFAAAGALIIPFLSDPGYRLMVLGTRESDRLFEIYVPIAGELRVYLAPVAVVVILVRYAVTHWSNRDVLIAFLALAFSTLLLFVPPMPGWYFWSIPLVSYFFIQREGVAGKSLSVLNVVYVAYYVLFWNLSLERLPPWVRAVADGLLLRHSRLESFAFTALQGSLAAVTFWVYRMGLQDNAALRARRIPVLVGIAGDSGSGKHTLARLLRDLLGSSAIQTNGDDYHRWPRGHEAWRTTTQLHPQGNRMALAVEHVESLKRGDPVRKALYDHGTGKFTDPMLLGSRPFVLVVGLHSFALRRMRELLDLKIYLDTNEQLRRQWKIERDARERGHTREQVVAALEAREADSSRFVAPQKRFADWTIRYELSQSAAIEVRHLLPNDLALEGLVDDLTGLAGVTVRWNLESDLEKQSLQVSGEPQAGQIRDIARRVFPAAVAQLAHESIVWRPGHDGISQLVFLAFLDDLAREARLD